MQLSQTLLNRVASLAEGINGRLMEPIIYHAKPSAVAGTTAYAAQGKLEQYSDHVVALHGLVPEGQVRREDRRLRVATEVVTWTPSTYDTVTREDGSLWRVLSIEGGNRRIYYFMQIRKVG
jgi:TolB-like protein